MRVLDQVRRWPPIVDDAALAVVVAVVTVVTVVVRSRVDEPLTAWGVVLLAVQLVPLVWRRQAPLAVATISWVGAGFYAIADLPDPPVMFGPLLGIYTLAAHRPRSVSVPFGAFISCTGALGFLFSGDSDAADLAVGFFTGITAWVVGDTTRGQRERGAWMETRRADAIRQAASDERIRIARDLHDIVAHHVSVIAVQAEAAQEVASTQPERATEAMGRVADTARSALVELRRLLGVLRSDSTRAPQPDLDAVDELVESVRRTGVPVVVRTTGEPTPVDPIVGLTAYRVIQEALTNVLKHAGSCRGEVGLDYDDGALTVTVRDDGRKPSNGDGSGQGLIGMRERVTMVGGELQAGPVAEGGFRVQARLPLDA